ncbi:hypothetical protein [Dyadobacter sp. CY312]|uniref:hypothetical protein n=1 Tax=Dyadobacter sp. CY312 TaxID=2907303 RepID=UPI001F3F15C9|nr:hypothetical protein [Dyadobacter sp. CY312]MCE7038977.1 hypothetical protein [Dyadobacter sp. CY312]
MSIIQEKESPAERKARKILKNLNRYSDALRDPSESSQIVIEKCLRKFEKYGPEAILIGKKVLMAFYQEIRAKYKDEDLARPEGQERTEEFLEKVNKWRHSIFRLGSEILKLEGKFIELDPKSRVAIEAEGLSEDMIFISKSMLVKSVSATSEDLFGKYKFHSMYSLQLTGVSDNGPVEITKADAKLIYDFFHNNNL